MSATLIEVGRLQQRSVGVLHGLTARVDEGQLVPTSEGLRIQPVPPMPEGQAPAAPSKVFVLLGNSLLAEFTPEERKEAEKLADDLNGATEKFRKGYERATTDKIKKLLD